MIGILQNVIDGLGSFLQSHQTVKSAWRAAVIVTLSALAQHFGFFDVVGDVARAGGG